MREVWQEATFGARLAPGKSFVSWGNREVGAVAQNEKRRRDRRSDTDRRGRSRIIGRFAGVASVVALLVVGFATTGGAQSLSTFNRWLGYSNYTTTTYHSTTTTSKPSTSSSYHSTTTSTHGTTTSTYGTTTTTKATTTTTTTMGTTTTTTRGGDGCTPGFWRQAHHYDSWVGFSPGNDYETVFGVDAVFDATLGQAVKLRGGGEFALARHAVAALLNSTSSGVDFAFTTAQVIDIVQDAYASGDFEDAKDMLADENEEGCPLR